MKTIPMPNTDPMWLLLTVLPPGAVVPQQCSLLTEPWIQLEKTFKVVVSNVNWQCCGSALPRPLLSHPTVR